MDKQKLIIILGAIVLFICISVIIIVIGSGEEKEVESVQYTLEYPLLLPKEPGYTGDYLFANTPRAKWTQEEVDEWFTVPTGENLDRLSASNDQVIKKILEAAP